MGLMNEYIKKHLTALDLEKELRKLIKIYEEKQGNQLFLYASAIGKPIPEISMCMDDYYIIYDMLKDSKYKKLDYYIETPGGSGESAEEIARFLHNKFKEVRFVVSGEAKSAGTILVLSGNDILMTNSGSLGPIDAQIKIGRCFVSAYDYMEWIDDQRKNAQTNKILNPVDATMIAQISPGEIKLVDNAKHFSLDLVNLWLPKFKFSSWNFTENRKIPVTEKMKKEAAEKVSKELLDHGKWRSHGRSLKIQDLDEIGLKVTKLDNTPEIADIIYRIQTVIRLLFNTTSHFKIFVTSDQKIFRSAVPSKMQSLVPPIFPSPKKSDIVKIKVDCPKCGNIHKIYAKFKSKPEIDNELKKQGFIPIPSERKLKCECGFEIDISGLINDIETRSGQKII